MSELTSRQLQLGILGTLSDRSLHHRVNLVGRPYQRGELELLLGLTFDSETRHRAAQALEDLVSRSLVRRTYEAINDPEAWVEITTAGEDAAERGALDDLDDALFRIGPHLPAVRAGAWEAVYSGAPDALRQAAHSGRELLEHVLKEGAPDDKVREHIGAGHHARESTKITRRHRLKCIMATYGRRESESSLAVVETTCDWVLAIHDKLTATSHSRGTPSKQEVIDALVAEEVALRTLLIPK